MDITAYSERQIPLSRGEKIMFLKNSLHGSGKIGVRNGDMAFVKQISEGGRHMVVERIIDLKKGETEETHVPLDKYNYFRYGYVGTVDKSQGATAPRAVGRDFQDFQRTYVAGTRENQELSLHFRDPEALREALNTYLTKSSSWEIKQSEAEKIQRGERVQERAGLREMPHPGKSQEHESRQQQKVLEHEM